MGNVVKSLDDIEEMTGAELYKHICAYMSFDEVIELYKRLKYKMETLEDPLEYTTKVAMYSPDGECVNAYETSVHC